MEKFVKELLTEETLEKTALLYTVEMKELSFVGGFENFIYGFNKKDKSYIIRITHSSHRTIDEVKAEIDFLYYLACHGANISMPIMTIHHELVEKINCFDNSYFIICAFTKAEGTVPSRLTITDRMIYNYGKTIGLFHKLTKNYIETEGIKKRFDWDQDLIILNASMYLPEEDNIVLERLQEIVEEIRTLEKNDDNFGLIHTDIHMGNFFIKDDELTVFDFDDAAYHYFASDLAIALFYLIFMVKEENQWLLADRFMDHFMRGYLEANILAKSDYLKIPIFLKLREIILYVAIYRSLKIEESEFAKAYINRYRDRIINNIPFLDIDLEKFYYD